VAKYPTQGASRRHWLLSWAGVTSLSLPLWVSAQPAAQRSRPKTPPVWTGFGLNGGAAQARYDLTREFVQQTRKLRLTDSEAFTPESKLTANLLAQQKPPLVQFKNSVEFGEDMLVGFAHDFETTVGARVEKDGENANTLFIFMSGVGMVLSFSQSTGWRIVSSFPFMLRFERPGGDLKNLRTKAVGYMGEAYKGYSNAFVHFLGRFNKWDQGFSSNYFARLTKASIHPDAQAKLASYKINQILNPELLGFSSSSAICDNLNIPLLPFQENDALAKRYAVKFSDNLAAQQEITIPDADLKFEVVLRDVDKKIIHSSQRGVTIIRRTLVIRFLAFDEFSNDKDKRFLNVLAATTHEDRTPLNSTEDDTPERDLVFFDRLLTRTLANLLSGLAKRDAQTLAQAEVRFDAVAPAIPRLLELCAKTR
jgi:hypothetical protein